MSNKQFQKYAQLPFRPFEYVEGLDKLNLRLLANVEPEQLFQQNDLSMIQAVLKNFIGSEISPQTLNFEVFSKLFRFSRLAFAHFSAQQGKQQEILEENYTKYKNLQDQQEEFEKLKQVHQEKKNAYAEELILLNEKGKQLKKKSESMGCYKCVYCSKQYTERETLESHVKRRHVNQLNEIYDTAEMLKANQDPTAAVKKRKHEEEKKQNEVELEKMKELEKKLMQQKVNEEKLIEEISKKLKSDFDLRLSQMQSQLFQNSEIKKEDPLENKLNEDNKENMNNKISQVDNQSIEDSLLKMANNFQSMKKALEKINESQVSWETQQKEQSAFLKRIVEGHEELKKSQKMPSIYGKYCLRQASSSHHLNTQEWQRTLHIQDFNSYFQTNNKDSFPMHAVPTADFSRDTNLKSSKFFEKPNQEEEDSFLNNSNLEEQKQKVHQPPQVVQFPNVAQTYQSQPQFPITSPIQTTLTNFEDISRLRQEHIGDLEEDYDSDDEFRKAYQEQKKKKGSNQGSFSKQEAEISRSKAESQIYQDHIMSESGSSHSSSYLDSQNQSKFSELGMDHSWNKKKKIHKEKKIPEESFNEKVPSNMNNNQFQKPAATVLRSQMSFGQKVEQERHEEIGLRKSAFGGQIPTEESGNFSENKEEQSHRIPQSSDRNNQLSEPPMISKKETPSRRNSGGNQRINQQNQKEGDAFSNRLNDLAHLQEKNKKKQNYDENNEIEAIRKGLVESGQDSSRSDREYALQQKNQSKGKQKINKLMDMSDDDNNFQEEEEQDSTGKLRNRQSNFNTNRNPPIKIVDQEDDF